jgi:hypothetical protein
MENEEKKQSDYRGVSWFPKRNKWRAQITVDSNTVHLGYYHLEEMAANAYDGAARFVYGKKAKTNDVEGIVLEAVESAEETLGMCERTFDFLVKARDESNARCNSLKGQLNITEALLAAADEALIKATERKKVWWHFW